MSAYKIFEQNHLSLKLVPVGLRELFLFTHSPFDFYIFVDGLFHIAVHKDETFNHKFFRSLIDQGHWYLFTYEENKLQLTEHIKVELQRSARALSIGNIQTNVSYQTNLLTLNLAKLYEDPMNDEILKLQFQTVRNLSLLMLQNKSMIKTFFEDFQKQKHYFITAQPLLSSVLLLAFLESTKMFNEKEIENLFITSYFKDIGMSFIPNGNFDKKDLTNGEKNLFRDHSRNSIDILKDRLPLQSNYLSIMANHHCLNDHLKVSIRNSEQKDLFVVGVETILLAAMDVLIAATASRPYRAPLTLFEVLEMLREPLGKEYPGEFKALVYFLRRFFIK